MTELRIEAGAADGRPRVTGTAYAGGKITLPGWRNPVVVDLSGMAIPREVPLLANHENRTSSRVGMVSATVRDGALEIEGEVLSESDAAKEIVAQCRAGAAWQLSIGAEVKAYVNVAHDRMVNGRQVEGPFAMVTRSVLREVSVVAVGADAETRMRVAASFALTPSPEEGDDNEQMNPVSMQAISNQEETMADNKTESAKETTENEKCNAPAMEAASSDSAGILAAERSRVKAIRELCKGEFPEVEGEAVACGWTPGETAERVLAALRAKRPAEGIGVVVKSAPEGDSLRAALAAALSLRSGLSPEGLSRQLGEKAVDDGMKRIDMSLREVLHACLDLEGVPHGRSLDNDVIRAAFSTVTLPGLLSDAANRKLLQSYKAQSIAATKLCTAGDLSDFRESERFRLTDVGDLLPVAPDGEIKEGSLSEESAKNQLETYGKKFCLTRKMVVNDDLGGFMKVPAAMGNRAARLVDQLFFGRLLKNPVQSDGKALFSIQHKNLLTGASSALSADSLAKGVQLFLDQVDSDGQPISVEPRYLLVPTALKHKAIELTRGAAFVTAGGSDNIVRPALNALADENLEVVSSPYLANSGYDGASSTAWYLFGAPGQVDTFEIGYLAGKRTPTVERGETDFNTLGIWFRVYFDIGVREQDHRGMTKANGAA